MAAFMLYDTMYASLTNHRKENNRKTNHPQAHPHYPTDAGSHPCLVGTARGIGHLHHRPRPNHYPYVDVSSPIPSSHLRLLGLSYVECVREENQAEGRSSRPVQIYGVFVLGCATTNMK